VPSYSAGGAPERPIRPTRIRVIFEFSRSMNETNWVFWNVPKTRTVDTKIGTFDRSPSLYISCNSLILGRASWIYYKSVQLLILKL